MRLSTARPASAQRFLVFSLLALAAAVVALAGCGGSEGTSSSTSAATSTPTVSTAATTTSGTTSTSSTATAKRSATAPTSSTTTTSPGAPAGSRTIKANPTVEPGAIPLSANPEGKLQYSTDKLTAKAGSVAIDFTNMSPLEHNVTLESSSHAVVGATPTFKGESRTLTVTLKPGTYKFFCSVPGHRMAGMEGTLVVK